MDGNPRRRSSLKSDVLLILALVAFIPTAVAGLLLYSRVRVEEQRLAETRDQAVLQAKYGVASFLANVRGLASMLEQSAELPEFLLTPLSLRFYSENRLYGRILELERQSGVKVVWEIRDLRSRGIFPKAEPGRPSAPPAASPDGFSVRDGFVVYAKTLRYDDQELAGPGATPRARLIGVVPIESVRKSVPGLLKLASLSAQGNPENIQVVVDTVKGGARVPIMAYLLSVSMCLVLSAVAGLLLIRKRILAPIGRLTRVVADRADGIVIGRTNNEIETLEGAFQAYSDYVQRTQSELLAQSRFAAMAQVASQVAHDIRSPLAALEVVSRNVAQLPEDKRILIRSAVGRIRDIANNLLDRQRAPAAGGASAIPEAASPQLLSSLIDPLVSEKRLQFRSQSRVEIELRLDASSYGIFAAVQSVELKRLISNLVNNAVEAFGEGSGTVSVGLASRDGRALVSVRDNGKGIPPEVLAKLGQRGETHGKAGGSGLGLYHARSSAESWGGSLELSSEIGKGTTATLVLPLAHAPEWFVPELLFIPGNAAVILDDDASIHQVWQGRLDVLKAEERGVEIVHVSSPDEIRNWVKGNNAKANQALYLFDYELLGFRETGLSLAEELALGERVVLVTSRYEEPEVLAGCRRLKARLIPKGLAGSVPMRVEASAPAETSQRQRLDAVLIDDDALTRMVWENAADDLGKRLWTYSTVDAFYKAADGIDRATPVYVDSNLGAGVEGAEESLRIHEMGFGEIRLATGHDPDRFARFKHLRGVIGKEPPWSA